MDSDETYIGLGVNIDESVSRVVAKSLGSFFRMIAFMIYALLNDYKQELDTAVKSDARNRAMTVSTVIQR